MKNIKMNGFMKNLKVAVKVILSFVIVALVTAFMSGMAQIGFRNIEEAANTFYTGPYKNKMICEQMKTEIEAVAKYAGYAIAIDDLSETESYINSMNEQYSLLYNNVEYWYGMTGDAVPAITNLKKGMESSSVTISEFANKLRSGDVDGATTLFFDDIYPLLMSMEGDIDAFTVNIDANATNAYNTIISTRQNASNVLTVLSIIAVFLVITSTLYLTMSLTQPIKEIEADAERMANGDFDGELTYESKDELGRLTDSMRRMKAITKAIIKDTDRGLGEVAKGNFNIAPEVEYPGMYKGIENSLGTIITQLSDTMSKINNASNQVLSGSEQVSSAAQALSQGATEQAASVEELSATLADISEKITDTAKNAHEGMAMSQQAAQKVEECNIQMTELVVAMLDINTKSNEISKIIKTIEDIAFQTNILALNAAVEAARAGVAGKGFAVVADEVRNLAGKSAEAAKDTTHLIEETINAVKRGADLVDSTATSLGEVVEKSSEVNKSIQLIADATELQANGIGQVTLGMEQINAVVQTNSATSEETAASSEELNSQAALLKSLVANFKLLDPSSFANKPKKTEVKDVKPMNSSRPGNTVKREVLKQEEKAGFSIKSLFKKSEPKVEKKVEPRVEPKVEPVKVKETPKREAPKRTAPKKEVVVKEIPKKELPKKEIPKKEVKPRKEVVAKVQAPKPIPQPVEEPAPIKSKSKGGELKFVDVKSSKYEL
ncbi:MAG: HAMP domain-containing protein [Erysipelotrichales bacterium]|nr:HAMP domain-containing protein [Erysipelotrichales bacterium]